MKSLTLTLATLLAPMAMVLANPTTPGLHIRAPGGADLDALPSSGMTWTGSITSDPSGPVHTFSGTAQSIYSQILALNPSYATLNPVLTTRTTEDFTPYPLSPLDKRQRREIDCNSGDPVATGDCNEGLNYLRALGNGEAMCGANPNGCARVSCSWRCGLELCNFGTGHFQVKCRDIARDIVDIMRTCTKNQQVRGRFIFDRHYTRVRWQAC